MEYKDELLNEIIVSVFKKHSLLEQLIYFSRKIQKNTLVESGLSIMNSYQTVSRLQKTIDDDIKKRYNKEKRNAKKKKN